MEKRTLQKLGLVCVSVILCSAASWWSGNSNEEAEKQVRKLAEQATGISAVLATQDDALYDMILATIDSMENNIETKQAALQYADEINNQITQRLIEFHMRK